MKDFSKVKGALAVKKRLTRKRAKALFPKIERFPLLYFNGSLMERRDQCSKVSEKLYQKIKYQGILIRPGHTKDRQWDHLETRVIDEKEEHIDVYLQCVDLLPAICEELQVPYITERPQEQ